ncbi:lysylphosphatidylglycerol synthase transmembrane domain-containing protein [candidate division KSB1 bacterium]
MKRTIFSVFKNLFFLFLGVGLLWLITKNQDIDEMIRIFKNADFLWVGIAIIAGIFSHIFRALRWNMLISSLGYETKTSTTFYAVMIGYFANYAIPRIGEITRCGIISKQNKIPLNAVIGTVIIERAFDMIVLAIIILATILLQLDFLGGFVYRFFIDPVSEKISNNQNFVLIIISVIVIIGVLSYLFYRYFLPKLLHLSLFQKIKSLFDGFFTGIKSIKKVKSLSLFFLHTVIIWTFYTLMVYLPFFSFGETSHLTFGDAITIMAMGSLGIVAPIPGGIGSYHFIVITVMVKVFHIAEDISTTFAYLVHTSQTVMIILIGGLSYLILFLLNKKSVAHANDGDNKNQSSQQ